MDGYKRPSWQHLWLEPASKPRHPTLLRLYAVFLFSLIPLFYTTLTSVAVVLVLDSAIRVSRSWRGDVAFSPGLAVALAALEGLLAIRIGWMLVRGLVGLVTEAHSETIVPPTAVRLESRDSPALIQMVRQISRQVGSVIPDEVYLTHRPICYAAELRWFGLTTQRRLVLMVGLPHLQVLSIEELRVILTHELAHFGGGDTWLAVFLFRFLESMQKSADGLPKRLWQWIDPVYWFSEIARKAVLILASPISHHQELLADSWSASLCGGTVAARTLLKEWQLVSQFDMAVASYAYDAQRESGTVFDWFRDHWEEISPDGYQYLERRLEEEELVGLGDSHPTMQQRLRVVRSYPDQYRRAAGRPASSLITNLREMELTLHAALIAELAPGPQHG